MGLRPRPAVSAWISSPVGIADGSAVRWGPPAALDSESAEQRPGHWHEPEPRAALGRVRLPAEVGYSVRPGPPGRVSRPPASGKPQLSGIMIIGARTMSTLPLADLRVRRRRQESNLKQPPKGRPVVT